MDAETKAYFDEMRADLNRRFDTVDRRFDEVDQRIAAVHEDLGGRIDQLSQSVQGLAGVVEQNAKAIDRLVNGDGGPEHGSKGWNPRVL